MSSFIDFMDKYPDENSALAEVFRLRYKDLRFCPKCAAETKFYRVKTRKCFACMHCGHQIYPLAGTIFQNTHIALNLWLFVLYLFSVSKHGVSAMEAKRHIKISYKTAFRMCHLIRSLMVQSRAKLKGTVEADEAYLGGEMINIGEKRYWKNHAVILGAVERKGEARIVLASGSNATTVIPFLRSNIVESSKLYTDDSRVYHRAYSYYDHDSVNHVRHQYAKGKVHTNTIEGFWSHMKRTLKGTYHGVSLKYLSFYIDEAAFRHNYRKKEIYPVLFERAII